MLWRARQRLDKFDAGFHAPVIPLWGGNIADEYVLWHFNINIDRVKRLMVRPPPLVKVYRGVVIDGRVSFHIKRR